jgi:hypothetical protein
MKIIQDHTEIDMPETIEVISAKYERDYDLKISFNDGTVRLIDFKPFLSKSLHPSIKKYQDKNLFRQFKIASGNINWNDFDLIFPIEDLYKGEIL